MQRASDSLGTTPSTVHFDGKRFPYYTFRRLIKVCAKKAKLDICVTAHTFRRSCATELLRGGANMYHVKELLGHESLETLKHYAKLTITDLKAPTPSAIRGRRMRETRQACERGRG